MRNADSTEILDLIYQDYGRWKQRVNPNKTLGIESSWKDFQSLKLSPGSSILEIGYGEGGFLLRAYQAGFQVFGLERHTQNQDILKNLGLEFASTDWQALSSESIDAVVAFDVFEHLNMTDMNNVLGQILRVLKPRARLLCRFPNAASPFGLANQFGDATHIQAWSGSSFIQFSMACGFTGGEECAPSYVWWGGSWIWKLIALPRWLLRRTIAFILQIAFYGSFRMHLDPNTIVIARK